MGATREQAEKAIRLIMLVNDVTLRNLTPAELAKGFGFFQSKPASAFSPVAVTPDELGAAWDGGKVNLPLLSFINGKPFGKPVAGNDMTFDFPALIVACRENPRALRGHHFGRRHGFKSRRRWRAGQPIAEGGLGYSCIAEQRMVETIRDGKPSTPFLKFGDRVKIEMLDGKGDTIFGAIEQEIRPASAAN